jgi:HEPN domain-containing protein
MDEVEKLLLLIRQSIKLLKRGNGDMSEIESKAKAKAKDILIKYTSQAFPNNPELINNLDGLFELLKSKQFPVDDKNRKLAVDFLKEAEVDIKACETLYKKKIYSRAIFNLQQAVEKATKGYVLGFGYIDFFKIRTHETPKLLLEATLEKTGIRDWAKQISDQQMSMKIEKAYDTLKNETSKQIISQITYEEIKQFLKRIENYAQISIDVNRQIFNQVSNIMASNKPLVFFESMSDWTILYGLAIITHIHESDSRYPDVAITPSVAYTKDLGIVRSTMDVAKRLKKTVRIIEDKIITSK